MQKLSRRLQESHPRRFKTGIGSTDGNATELKDKRTYTHLKVLELHKNWAQIFWAISKGQKSDYDSLKGTEVQEFFNLFDQYEKSLNKE